MAEMLRLGTRGSRLALAQAAIAAEALARIGLGVETVTVRTEGDAISERRPRAGWVTTDGQFTRALESALLDGDVDVVVHSYKDLPTAPVDGLAVAAVLRRADPRDCLVTADGGGLEAVPFGGRIGTSSPRRAAQLAASRNDLVAMPIRGNVESRLARLERGEYDGLILAAAGLDRLGIDVPPAARLPLDFVLPAPAQGALALQVRAADAGLCAGLAAVDDRPTRIGVEAERALLRRIGGGCLAPLGALGEVEGDRLRLRAAYEDRGGAFRRAEATGPAADPEAVVAAVADELLASGVRA
ncbi:MAG TPA: hydroxymethylbilane synthase [Candidatus Limnocylindria bacterium]|nr:hydroxymethylbilane synthase [Candidatus Limnocylindria bacterium]